MMPHHIHSVYKGKVVKETSPAFKTEMKLLLPLAFVVLYDIISSQNNPDPISHLNAGNFLNIRTLYKNKIVK